MKSGLQIDGRPETFDDFIDMVLCGHISYGRSGMKNKDWFLLQKKKMLERLDRLEKLV